MKSDFVSKRILITGIEGFTGKHLSRILEQKGAEVWGTSLHSSRERVLCCDICDRACVEEVVAKVNPHYVFHLAGKAFTASRNSEAFYSVNVFGTENLLTALRKYGQALQKILVTSSATVYGPQNSFILDETMCPAPVQHYGYSKYIMEKICTTLFNELPLVVVRPFNYTGPGQDECFVVPKIVGHFRRRASVIELGNLDVYREFNDVRYVIECYLRLMASDVSATIVNVASQKPVALSEILEILTRLTDHHIEVRTNPSFVRKNEIHSLCGSVDKLATLISLPKTFSLEETLKWMLTANDS